MGGGGGGGEFTRIFQPGTSVRAFLAKNVSASGALLSFLELLTDTFRFSIVLFKK